MPLRLTVYAAACWIIALALTLTDAMDPSPGLIGALLFVLAAAAVLSGCSFVAWQARLNRDTFWRCWQLNARRQEPPPETTAPVLRLHR